VGECIFVVTPRGTDVVLKGAAVDLWKCLDNSSISDLLARMVQRYQIPLERATHDLEIFLINLQRNGLAHIDGSESEFTFPQMTTMAQSQDILFSEAYRANVPIKIYFNLTFRCNLRCIHCYAGEGIQKAKKKRDALTLDEIYRILVQLAESGCFYITLTGGEPLCHPHLKEVLEFSRELGFSLRLNTNGTLVTPVMAQYIREAGVKRVLVSIYGADEATHDNITRIPGSYRRTWQGINALRGAGVPVTLAFLVMAQNYKGAPKILELAHRANCDLSLNPLVMPDFFSGWIPPVRLDAQQMEEFLSMGLYQPKKMECTIGRQCVVAYNGDVYPCLAQPIAVGNLRQQSFQEIWSSTALQHFRQNPEYAPPPVCKACSFFRHCHRCPAVALLENGNLQAPMPMACRLMQAYEHIRAKGNKYAELF